MQYKVHLIKPLHLFIITTQGHKQQHKGNKNEHSKTTLRLPVTSTLI